MLRLLRKHEAGLVEQWAELSVPQIDVCLFSETYVAFRGLSRKLVFGLPFLDATLICKI